MLQIRINALKKKRVWLKSAYFEVIVTFDSKKI
jgi:hypothetical protein